MNTPGPIRVLFVIDHLGTGGAQEFLCHLCRRVPRDKVCITVCTLRDGQYRQQLEAIGIRVYSLADRKSLLRLPVVAHRLYHLLRHEQFDLVHTLLEASFVIATPLARLCRIPNLHSVMITRQQSAAWFFPLKAAYQHWVDLFLTPFPDELRASGVAAVRIKAIDVTIDVTEMVALTHRADLPLEPFDLGSAWPLAVSIGRLVPDKGHEYAIRAWPTILRRWPAARLLVVGNGDDEGRLRDLTTQLGLSDAVLFAGFRRDLPALLSRADLYIRTALKEGINLTTIQALAAGVPTIGFKTLVPQEIIEDGVNGLLVPLRDVESLAGAMERLIASPDLRAQLSSRARAGIRRDFDPANDVRLYEAIYSAVSKRHPRPDAQRRHLAGADGRP